MEEELKRMGFTIQAAVNKVTKILLVPDSADLTTQKIQKARDLGIKILRRSTWREEIKTVL
jgi:NAD-dependent DNA ligase